MPSSNDDRRPRPAVDAATRTEIAVPKVRDEVHDEDSLAETEVFVGAVHKDTVTKLAPPPTAKAKNVGPATVREAPHAPVSTPPPRSRLGQTVSIVRAPLDEQGFGARY